MDYDSKDHICAFYAYRVIWGLHAMMSGASMALDWQAKKVHAYGSNGLNHYSHNPKEIVRLCRSPVNFLLVNVRGKSGLEKSKGGNYESG